MEDKKINQEPENSATPTTSTEEKVKETLNAGKEALTAGAGKLKEKATELKAKAQQAQAEKQSTGNETGGANPSRPPKKGKKLLIIGAAAALVLILIITMFSGGRTKVDMEDYITVNFSGLNGKGTAQMSIDYTGLSQVSELTSTSKWSKSELESMIYLLGEEWAKRDMLEHAFKCTLEADQGTLSNGDKVTVNVAVSDETCKALNIKVKPKTISVKVEGLTQVTAFDAFADIEVSFSGIAPNGKATLMNNSRDEACMSYTYSLDVNSGLSNGDTVTVTISENAIDRVAEQTGKAPEVMSKQYTVTGLSAYVTELSQISGEAMKSMQKEAEDGLNAHIAKSWADVEHLEGMKYLGSYLLVRKPHVSSGNENILFLVYEISYGNTYNDADYHTTYYYYVRYRNLYNDGDGKTVVDLSDRATPSNWLNFEVRNRYGSAYYTYGYQTLQDLFQACVTSSIDNYTYESSVS